MCIQPDDDQEPERREPLCPTCKTTLDDAAWPGVVRAIGWWLLAMAPVTLAAGLAVKQDVYFLAAGGAFLAGVLLSGIAGVRACPSCGGKFRHEPPA